MERLACCNGLGGVHTARLNFQSDVDGWYTDLLKAHPGLYLNLPMWQHGPPRRILGMRVIDLDGPVSIGVKLGPKPL